MIYLASPYNHENPAVCEQRAFEAARAVAYLMRLNHVVYSPIVHNHAIAKVAGLPLGWDFWQRFDTEMLTAAASVVVLTLDGWAESAGIRAELEIAVRQEKSIRYLNPTPRGFELGEFEDYCYLLDE